MDTHGQKQIEVMPHHRTRLAVVYVRTAAMPDTLADYTDLKTQRDQAQRALTWGWPQSAIHFIEDLGTSGVSAEGRLGWQRLLDLIRQGQVGMLLVSDLSRLSRTAADIQVITDLCAKTQTLLVVEGGIVGLDPADALRQALAKCFCDYERGIRVRRFFPNVTEQAGPGGTLDDLREVAVRPDCVAYRVVTALASDFKRLGAIAHVAENAGGLANELPRPGVILLEEVITLLREFDEACQVWRCEHEPSDC
jgi:DNA invertase Pin-like site-specific DNA recombinase